MNDLLLRRFFSSVGTNRSLCFEANGSQTVSFVEVGTTSLTPLLQYSFDNSTWNEWDLSSISFGGSTKVYIRGINTTFSADGLKYWHFVFGTEAEVTVTGSYNALLSYQYAITKYVTTHSLASLFRDCTQLVSAAPIEQTEPYGYDYYGMFRGCTSLVKAPSYTYTSYGSGSSSFVYTFAYMFYGCSSLSDISDFEISALGVSTGTYSHTFAYCELIENIRIPSHNTYVSTDTGNSSHMNMFQGCTGLVSAVVYVRNISPYAFAGMFSGCSSLNNVKCDNYPRTEFSIEEHGTDNWMNGVAAEGTFTTKRDYVWVRGSNGVPEGWTITYR